MLRLVLDQRECDVAGVDGHAAAPLVIVAIVAIVVVVVVVGTLFETVINTVINTVDTQGE